MPHVSSSSFIPVSQPPFSSSLFKCSHQLLLFESWGREKKNPDTYKAAHQGNPSPLSAFLFSRRPTRSTQSQWFLTSKRNCGAPTSHDAELHVWVEKDGSFHTEGEIKGMGFVGEDGGLPDKGNHSICDSIEEHSLLGTEMKQENLDMVEKNDEMFTVEQDSPINFVQAKGSLPTKDVDLPSSGKRSSKLNVGDFVKKIARLPIEERVKVLDLLEYENELLTISDYNDILAALVKAGELESAVTLFSELPSRGLSPDSWSFSIMIRCLCKKHEPDEAKLVLENMVRSGFQPNVATFTFLVNCLCKRGKLKKAFEVFEIMNRVGIEPTIRTYNCLINGLCYVGRVEDAFDLLNKIKKSLKAPDIYTFTLVMDGFCKVGRSDEAMELLVEAKEMGLSPTIVTYNALLHGLCREGRPFEGLRLLKEMEDGDCQPDLISYKTLLHGLLKWGEISAALEIYKKMVLAGFQVEEREMNTLLRGLCRKSMTSNMQLREAKELSEKIMAMGYNLSPYTYSLVVQALAKGGEIDRALYYLLEMVRTGYSPRMLTYNVILRILCGKGRIDDAFYVFILMIKRDTIPSRFSFNILVDGFNRQQRLLEALGVYAAAIKWGVAPHRKPRKDWKCETNFIQSKEGKAKLN